LWLYHCPIFFSGCPITFSTVSHEVMTCEWEAWKWIAIAGSAFGSLQKSIGDLRLALFTKVHFFRTCMLPVLLYGSETLKIFKKNQSQLYAFDMKTLSGYSAALDGVTISYEQVYSQAKQLPICTIIRLSRLDAR